MRNSPSNSKNQPSKLSFADYTRMSVFLLIIGLAGSVGSQWSANHSSRHTSKKSAPPRSRWGRWGKPLSREEMRQLSENIRMQHHSEPACRLLKSLETPNCKKACLELLQLKKDQLFAYRKVQHRIFLECNKNI